MDSFTSASSYFEVTVNSTRLSHLLEDITKTMGAQYQRILNLSEQLKGSASELENKMRSQQTLNNQQFDIVRAMIKNGKEESTSLITSVDRHLFEHKKDTENMIECLNQKIIKTGDNCNEQSQSILESLSSEVKSQTIELEKSKKSMMQTVAIVDEKVAELSNSSNQEFQKLKDMILGPMAITRNSQPKEFEKIQQRLSVFGQAEQQSNRKKLDENKVVRFAAISAKLNELEHKIYEKDNIPINKIVYAGRTSNFSPQLNSPRSQMGRRENSQKMYLGDKRRRVEFGRQCSGQQFANEQAGVEVIHQKLIAIETIINGKFKFCIKDLEDLKYKSTILDERFGILSRKLDRGTLFGQQVKGKIQQLEEKQVDERLIDTLRNEISRCVKRTEDMVETKCNKDIFEKDRAKNYEKLSIIHENIAEKADKTEIKKALLFLQDKIKDIIVLIADDHNTEKDGAMTRLPLKCLSCDKDVQTHMNLMANSSRTPIARSSENSMRTVSSKIRRRIRLGNSSGNLS